MIDDSIYKEAYGFQPIRRINGIRIYFTPTATLAQAQRILGITMDTEFSGRVKPPARDRTQSWFIEKLRNEDEDAGNVQSW